MVLKEYNFKDLREQLLNETKEKISSSVSADNFISQAINSIAELDRVANILAKRLREWYELYNPELSKKFEDHEKFADKVLKTENSTSQMGGTFELDDLEQAKSLAEKLKLIYHEKDSLVDYLRSKMEFYCPKLIRRKI